MATERTRTEIEAILADNNTGDIAPADHRDGLLGSALGGYAGMVHTLASGVGDMLAVGATFEQIDIYDLVSVESIDDNLEGAKASLVTFALTPGVDGVYLFSVYGAFTLGSNNKKVLLRAFVNDTGTDLEIERFFSNGSNIASYSLTHPFRLSGGDKVDFRVSVDSGPVDIAFSSAGLAIVRVG